nr:MAG TPA: hypothetical protein [Caudoviricetes sp.]
MVYTISGFKVKPYFLRWYYILTPRAYADIHLQ